MTDDDPVLARLAALPMAPLDPQRSQRIRAAALRALRPRALHPAWAMLVAGSTLCYLVCSLWFTLNLF